MKPIVEKKNLIRIQQFGFGNKHSRNNLVHRIKNFIAKTYEEKETCLTIFVHVAQSFDTAGMLKLQRICKKFFQSSMWISLDPIQAQEC